MVNADLLQLAIAGSNPAL